LPPFRIKLPFKFPASSVGRGHPPAIQVGPFGPFCAPLFPVDFCTGDSHIVLHPAVVSPFRRTGACFGPHLRLKLPFSCGPTRPNPLRATPGVLVTSPFLFPPPTPTTLVLHPPNPKLSRPHRPPCLSRVFSLSHSLKFFDSHFIFSFFFPPCPPLA